MKRIKRILLVVGCAALLLISWFTAFTAKSDTQRQAELMEEAAGFVADEAYIRAVPLLEEAAGYSGKNTRAAEEDLKNVYLHLMDQSGVARKYMDLLDRQMARKDAAPEVFLEAAQYYLDASQAEKAFGVLRNGIKKLGSEALVELYEANRYQYQLSRTAYHEASAICNGAAQVKQDGYWGLASADGELVIPCEYDRISTFSGGRAVAMKGDTISCIDADNNRLALFHGEASGFSNYGDDRLGLDTPEGWFIANGEFHTGTLPLEEIGMYADGCAPAKLDGKWGVLSTDGTTWIIPAEYDGVIQDELGRCCAQNAVFVQKGAEVLLFVDGEQTGGVYEDARPFADGWAAVKQDGKWGFIDTEGSVCIDYQFEDALSFGQHLAAVKQGMNWGYISLRGEMVIEPVFLNAKSFSRGSAPVETRDGWQFITLLEYKEGASVL